jgi:hypothetical protein
MAKLANFMTYQPGSHAFSRTVRQLVLVSSVLVSSIQVVTATSIVAIRTDDSVFIGADSLRTFTQGRTATRVCKIRPIGDGHFAGASGLVENQDLKFFLWEHIQAAASGGGSLDAKLARLDKRLIEPLKATVKRMDLLFSRVEVLFVGIENRVPRFLYRVYMPALTANGAIYINVTRCSDCHLYRFTSIGIKEALNKRLLSDPGFIEREPITVVRDAIMLEVANKPSAVGPPVNILRIDRKGAQWVENGEVCGNKA